MQRKLIGTSGFSELLHRLLVLTTSLTIGIVLCNKVWAAPPSYSLESGQWHQLVIPGKSTGESVESLFADDLPASGYGRSWVIYRWDAQAGEYVDPGLTGEIPTGSGFWFIQLTGSSVSIDVPGVAAALLTKTPACSSANGCSEAPLVAKNTSTFNMVGSAQSISHGVDALRLRTSAGDGSCSGGCTHELAADLGLVDRSLWHYDGATNDYVNIADSGTLNVWESMWVRTQPSLAQGDAHYLFPAASSAAADNLAMIQNNATRNTQYDNNPFRNVPARDIAVSDLTLDYDIYNERLLDTTNSGYFRVKCEVSHFAYDDPIVYPNQPGRAHLHMFFGNTEAHAYSTYDSLLNSGTGTCNGEDLNRTAYWVPALLDSQGNALIPDQIMVYYKNDNFRLNGANELVSPFPENLRMISGRGSATSPQTELSGDWGQPIISFSCGPAYNSNHLRQALIPDCSGSGNQLEMQIAFPQCVNEDLGYQPDQSHISYSENGYYGVACPDSHPTDISSIMYRIFFKPDDYGGSLTNLHLSSDVKMDRILPGGTTSHADWYGAWHPEAMDMWVENCNNSQNDCETGLLSRDPPISLVLRKRGFYPRGYLAPASELIKLCPGKTFDPNDPLRSVAMCRHG